MQPIVSIHYKFVNDNKQPQAIKTCKWCVYITFGWSSNNETWYTDSP